MTDTLVLSEPAAADAAREPLAMPLFIVMNPGSGDNEKAQVRADITQALSEAGRRFEFVPVHDRDIAGACRTAGRLASEQGGAIVAVGGDGTINAAAQVAVTQGCPLGVIAQGTFNLFAREYGLPLEAAPAARVVATGLPQPVEVGLINQRVFLVNASLGLYPRVLADREVFKRKLGRHRWVAFISGVVSLLGWRRQLRLDAELDGRQTVLRTPTLFVGNNREQLERVGLDEELVARARHGWLVALVAKPQGRWAKFRLALRAALGRLGDSEEVDNFPFRTLLVKGGRRGKFKVATDGEVLTMESPLRFSISPKPLRLLLPSGEPASA